MCRKETGMKCISAVLVSLLFHACVFPTSEDVGGGFALYLLRDSTIVAQNAFSQTIESLALADSALFTVRDLRSYVWSTHAFSLTGSARDTFEQFLLSHGKTSGVPFVVTVGQDRIYLGTFWWAYSSSMPPPCAVIDASGPLPHRIGLANGAIDKRSDPRIYISLKAASVLQE
jgi:hypothetical protein